MPAPPQFRAGEPQPTQASLGDAKWFDIFQDETLRDLIQRSADGQLRHPHRRAACARRPKASCHGDAVLSLPATRCAGGLPRATAFNRRSSRPGMDSDGASWESISSANCAAQPRPRALISWRLEENAEGGDAGAGRAGRHRPTSTCASTMRNSSTCGSPSRPARSRSNWWRRASKAASPACSKSTRPRRWSPRPRRRRALLEKAQEQTENLINFLIGKQPGPVERGNEPRRTSRSRRRFPPACRRRCWNAGPTCARPSSSLVAANARVGVAKAAFYPEHQSDCRRRHSVH